MSKYCDFRLLPIEEQQLYIAGAVLPAKWTTTNRKKFLGDPSIIDERPYHPSTFTCGAK